MKWCLAFGGVLAGLLLPAARAQIASGTSVLRPERFLSTPVGGLERTQATAQVVPVTGQPFTQALRVTIGTASAETQATQLTLPTAVPVVKGDVLLASFAVRGSGRGTGRAQAMLLFERAVSPWTKSIIETVTAPANPQAWKRVTVSFAAAETYPPGGAMVSVRFAFGPQTVDVGGLSVVNFGKTRTVDALRMEAAQNNPLGRVHINVHRADTRQTLLGLGGNFCQPRYGDTEPTDAVGQYNLAHLRVAQARVGIPLNIWARERGTYHDDLQAHAALLQMQDLTRRNIPLIGTVWEGPTWMLPGQPEQSGRTLAPEEYAACVEAVAQFLVTARDKYGVAVAAFSFNEPDAGINFRFTPAQMAAFIRQAGPRFHALGLSTRFLVGDTTGGEPLPDYAVSLLSDPALAPFLGPIAFHSWDVLGATDAQYAALAALGRRTGKPVWCTEAGHDAALWQADSPWGTWENALRTAQAYARTLRLSGASVLDYWTYQNNYPVVDAAGLHPYPVFSVLQQMEDALPHGARVVGTVSDTEDLETLATTGPQARAFSVLLAAPAGGGLVTLSGLPPGVPVTVTLSTQQAQNVTLPGRRRVDKAGHLTVDVPPRAVVTVRAVP